ncbi:RNA-binding domain-containing protein [Bathymodiolus thermophilus thioautotrophic gill symbiont]|uniref:Schlafen AlbA-2 domain-containing protein n=1 Tax=Bathymodiolus thermophilus thioautotrophic gill symbiont TaxID=2360 RepID=A0A1J5U7Y8_9GAMM|nr:RNA-binding domain-containing protein [Bathymodiolus thermophilus thioautotrophic gill symbiont]OIR24958.1 hypothetical protein BGC33_05050 [Bathymodiolus thermophilus thioautotrophic gill symbiont]
MLDKDKILAKIDAGETSGIEFKQVIVKHGKIQLKNHHLSDEIAAFANHRGGLIIFGVEDKTNQIIGIDKDICHQVVEILSSICHDLLNPSLVDFYIDNVAIDDKYLVYIEINRSLWLHESGHGYFYRHGDSKRKMSTEHILRIGQARSQARIIRFDEQSVPSTNIGILQKSFYQRFIPDSTNEELDLKKRNLLYKDGSATVAGVLMCSPSSDDYLYNSFIQAVYYNGVEKDANYQIDAQDFKGVLDQQIINAFKFVKQYNKISATKEVGRTERPQYSMKAIFEAIVNAVVHRDYSKSGSKIRLFMFSNRLELYSPGALANTLAVDTLISNQITRNELLTRLLSEIELDDNMKVGRKYFLERRGEGVGIIMRESEQLSGKAPIYQVNGEELQLTIFPAQSLQGENDDD